MGRRRPGGMEAGVVWWCFMVVVTVFNVFLCVEMVALRHRRKAEMQLYAEPQPVRERNLLRVAAVVFTFVCGYRAVLPRIDVPRICWFDTPLNWVLFGRLAATVAEIGWVTQMGLVTRRLAMAVAAIVPEEDSIAQLANHAKRCGTAVIALACIAECCSWTNLISECNLFAVFEQGLWSVLFLITGTAMARLLLLWPERPVAYWIFVVLAIGMGIEQSYEAFGLYLPRYISDEAKDVHYTGFADGLSKLAACAKVSQDMATWSADVPWMTGYFSVAVWTSIWLSTATFPQGSSTPATELSREEPTESLLKE